jgi:hypothetical protein
MVTEGMVYCFNGLGKNGLKKIKSQGDDYEAEDLFILMMMRMMMVVMRRRESFMNCMMEINSFREQMRGNVVLYVQLNLFPE